jgi:hypothetical protein
MTTPYPVLAQFESNHVVSPPKVDMMDMSLHIPSHTGGKSSRLAELDSSLLPIQFKQTSMQSDHTQL